MFVNAIQWAVIDLPKRSLYKDIAVSTSGAFIRQIHNNETHRIKDAEKAVILSTIVENPGVSRKGISDVLSCRPSTVSDVAQELLNDGLVLERTDRSPAGKGRPQIGLELSPSRLVAIAIYVVSREVRVVLVNLQHTVLMAKTIHIPESCTNQHFVTLLARQVSELKSLAPAGCEITGLSLSLPGFVDRNRRRWLYNSRWPRIRKLNIELIEKATGLAVLLTRFPDAELDHLILERPAFATGGTLLFHWGFGIGASYSHDGVVLQSTHGAFLEIGHWRAKEANDRACPCGSRGCVETVAAMWALLPSLRETFADCPEDEHEFGHYLAENDPDGGNELVVAETLVSRILAQLYTVFFPDHFLVFGPFFRNQSILQRVRHETARQIPSIPGSKPDLVVVADRFEGSVTGSVVPLFREALRGLLTARW